MYDALYARQSVEKADSISVESQLEFCKYETRGNSYKIYTDKGFSGKNTNRPAFEEMLEDIKDGRISRVIVYKLDRISRSILDFANMMEIFRLHHVEFISSTERFDTSTPIGRAMLNICIVFAQLERETIQKRVTDAYYARCKRGFFMGGRTPYGFSRKETIIDGIKTSMYIPVPEEKEQICRMYSLYGEAQYSLGDIVRYLNEHGMEHLRGGMWNTARISEILRNPVYVKADAEVYEFFKSQGTSMMNPVSDFTGHNGCYLYKCADAEEGKQWDLSEKELVLAPHEGIVSSREWMKCRLRCMENRQSTRTCKAKNSWLAGKVKCGRCGYGLTIVKSNTRWHRYFVCSASLSTKKSRCQGTGGTVYADVLEEYIQEAVGSRLAEFSTLSKPRDACTDPQINAYRIRMAQIDEEIEGLLTRVADANEFMMQCINEKGEALNIERKKLEDELSAQAGGEEEGFSCTISNHVEVWKHISFEDKQAVADTLIKVITIADGTIEITWNI